MILRTCINCRWGRNLTDDAADAVPCVCVALPFDVMVQDGRFKSCSMFSMLDSPRLVMEDRPPQENEREEEADDE